MKCRLDFTPPTERNYPCLLIHQNLTGLVVMFVEKGKGFVVSPDRSYDLGSYREKWNECDFYHFNGKITLEN